MPIVRETQDAFRVEVQGPTGGEVTLAVLGRLSLANLSAFIPQVQGALERLHPARLTLDLGELKYLDTAAALILKELESDSQARSIPFAFARPNPEVQRMLGLIDQQTLGAPSLAKARERYGFLVRVGNFIVQAFSDFVVIMTFMGELIIDLVTVPVKARAVRWGDVVTYTKKIGVEGLPIITLMSLLLGLIIAFMTSLQLRQFGANIYVASLLAIAMVQELGPIMTAIIVAGRSGSAFAAEIGTMKVNEEVDALATMGFDPVKFLAIPKVLASLVAVPLLTFYADLFGILGGMLVGVLGLDLGAATYITETQRSIELFDLVFSFVKSLIFAVIIAGIGCQRGFKVRGGAQAVGEATTSAVVASIFMIIVVDSAFALVHHYIQL